MSSLSGSSTVLVTGSSGHLGKALMLTLSEYGYHPIGIDIKPSPTTTLVGSITDDAFVAGIFEEYEIEHVIHAATLHKPHVGSHSKMDFVQTNMVGTLNLLEAASVEKVKSFVYISTTSAFGSALKTRKGEPAAWINEDVVHRTPKNIYGSTKTAAEDLCVLFHQEHGLKTAILRTSRFFPEEDDDDQRREDTPDDENLKVVELAYRRVDIADVVSACVCAVRVPKERIKQKGRMYVVSAPTCFERREEVLKGLDEDAEGEYERAMPGAREVFEKKGWVWPDRVDRVYDSNSAVEELGWKAEYTFGNAIKRLREGREWRSELTFRVGRLGYHEVSTGVYTKRD
ncbi:hypothetical protein QBC35DRAFT_450670 [Podospora australis]|uniref:NAD-dependent epimerase/dehydratase domain-containing protein n=1 Tax=Podospora australis TaxID=1536484 RepID=A0AAN7AJ33_9PEZI|nr:hypothetical protein QBC35DRAFT_450670 [Podospora australis]